MIEKINLENGLFNYKLCLLKSTLLQLVSVTSGNSHHLSFYCHMYGSNKGTLHVDVQNGGVWTEGIWMLNGSTTYLKLSSVHAIKRRPIGLQWFD